MPVVGSVVERLGVVGDGDRTLAILKRRDAIIRGCKPAEAGWLQGGWGKTALLILAGDKPEAAPCIGDSGGDGGLLRHAEEDHGQGNVAVAAGRTVKGEPLTGDRSPGGTLDQGAADLSRRLGTSGQ